ncbi:MAG: hypothetical protein J2P46_00395, partial [Zavarzinella sp.]|nr:hypothetical protein [Zavarzinella sp.]
MRPTEPGHILLFFVAHAASIVGALALSRLVNRRIVRDRETIFVHAVLWNAWLIGELCGLVGM